MNLAIVCSDDRMRQIYDNLSRDKIVLKIEEDTHLDDVRGVDAIILPVKGITTDDCIPFEHDSIQLDDIFWEHQSDDLVIFSGVRNERLEQLPFKKIYYMEDHNVIRENAILTAEGVLNLLIGATCKSIYAIDVDVIGYGNCGKVIFEMLRNLHVRVRMIRRDCENDEYFCKLSDWKQCGDIVINTSIQKVLTQQLMGTWKKTPVIIDIATPDVIDLDVAAQLDIEVMKAANLPGRFACITAGNIVAAFIREELWDER